MTSPFPQSKAFSDPEVIYTQAFDIGDRVVAIAPVGPLDIKGVHGTVVGVDYDEDGCYLAVNYDEDIGGHDLGGLNGVKCKTGHGWWTSSKKLSLAAELDDIEISQSASLF